MTTPTATKPATRTRKPAAKKEQPAPAPAPVEQPSKASKQAAKQDLARRAVLALDAMFSNLDPSDAALTGWTKAEAAQCLANWVHHFPTGSENGKRTWPAATLPKPQRSDW